MVRGEPFRQCSSKYPAGRWENCSMGWSKIFLLASLAFSVSFAARQLRGNGRDSQAVSFNEVSAAGPDRDGKRCIDKVEMIEETEYDDVVQCDHSYDKRCHTTYVTNYESQQEEECEENYRK